MKNITRLAIIGLLVVVFMGCYKQTRLEQMGTPVQFNLVDLDDPAPSQDESDVILATHIKKASYLLSPRTAEMPYTFTLIIDGQEVKEEVKGVEEVESDMKTEEGKGVHYILKKRFRLKPGRHEIALKTEERSSAKIKMELSGGRIHDLKFEPVYGHPLRTGIMKTFVQGIKDYEVYLNGNKISKE